MCHYRLRAPTEQREHVVNVANGGLALSPESLHDLQFQLGQFGFGHAVYYYRCVLLYYIHMYGQVFSCGQGLGEI
jgi:hypothetical protein